MTVFHYAQTPGVIMAQPKKSSFKTRFKPLTRCSLNIAGKSSLLAASLFISSNAFGLGLGSLVVSSNLDQPLAGRIELNVQPSDDISGLTAVIAPRSDFDSLGLDYPDYLKDIGIVVDSLGATPALVITSNNVVIKEPFINLLVRVEWPGGSFLREYTALIDPPVYAAETPQLISEPKLVGTDQTSTEDVPGFTEPAATVQDLDNDIVDEVVDETVDEVVDETVDEVVDEAVDEVVDEVVDEPLLDNTDSTDIVGTLETTASEQANTIPTDAQYGPVLRGESLSVIAQELQQQFPDLSIYQIMQVLFEDNSNAFIDGNINGLIQGSLLRVADLQAIKSVDIDQSREFFREQVIAWNASDFSNPSTSSDAISVDDDNYNFDSDFSSGSDSSTDDSLASGQENFQVGSSSEASDFVSADQSGSQDGEVLALRDEITTLEASLASSNLENQELTERISLLEGQLADMNRLLDLGVENADLAQVESSLAAQNNDELTDVDDSIDEFLNDTQSLSTDAAEDDIDSLLADVTGDVTDGVEQTFDDSNSSISEFLSDDESTDDPLAVNDDALIDTELGIDEAPLDEAPLDEPIVEETIAPIADVTATKPEESKGFLGSILSNGLWKIIAGVGGLLAAALALLFFRRRRADEEFEVSMLSIESNSQTVDAAGQSLSAASMSATQSARVSSVTEGADKETSFLTVYSDSDAVVQADEVDPVAEADVYIAYGRDEQAEEVLRDGVANQPDRADIKFKLLTLYHKSTNTEGFERIAEELYSSGNANSEMWKEVVEMGQEISPSNPLFSLSVTDIEVSDDTSADKSNDSEPVADESPSTADMSDEQADDSLPADDSLDETPNLENSDGSIALDASADDVSPMTDALDNEDTLQSFNFEDGGSETSELGDEEISALEVDANSSNSLEELDISDNLGSLEADSNVVQLLAEDGNDGEIELDIDEKSSLEFETVSQDQYSENDSEEDDEGERSLREVQEVSDLEIDQDYDESRTQYELARVFVDLGDEDGAKRILNELVANDHNDQSVLSDARELLDSIS